MIIQANSKTASRFAEDNTFTCFSDVAVVWSVLESISPLTRFMIHSNLYM